MKQVVLTKLVGLLMGMLTPELLRKLIDMLLDWIEREVEESEGKLDDAIILPICELLRTVSGTEEKNE